MLLFNVRMVYSSSELQVALYQIPTQRFNSCQCGISRSATLIIALVMRAAALRSTSVPPEVWALKGYQQSYSFVKNKSKWVGPNMS